MLAYTHKYQMIQAQHIKLPELQLRPVHPGLQSQRNSDPSSRHVPPFIQGSDAHGTAGENIEIEMITIM